MTLVRVFGPFFEAKIGQFGWINVNSVVTVSLKPFFAKISYREFSKELSGEHL